MEKKELILNIEALYPTDCPYADTNAIGKVLLQQAIENVKYDWRDMPLIVLEEYRRLCVEEEENGETTRELRNDGTIS